MISAVNICHSIWLDAHYKLRRAHSTLNSALFIHLLLLVFAYNIDTPQHTSMLLRPPPLLVAYIGQSQSMPIPVSCIARCFPRLSLHDLIASLHFACIHPHSNRQLLPRLPPSICVAFYLHRCTHTRMVVSQRGGRLVGSIRLATVCYRRSTATLYAC